MMHGKMHGKHLYILDALSIHSLKIFLCSLYACETIICTNYITKHFERTKSIHFRLRNRTHIEHSNAAYVNILHFHFSKWQFNGLFVNGFFKKNVCFQETNEMEWGRKKKRKTLKGFECVCARCNVTNLELMTINSYFNSNALIQLKLKST